MNSDVTTVARWLYIKPMSFVVTIMVMIVNSLIYFAVIADLRTDGRKFSGLDSVFYGVARSCFFRVSLSTPSIDRVDLFGIGVPPISRYFIVFVSMVSSVLFNLSFPFFFICLVPLPTKGFHPLFILLIPTFGVIAAIFFWMCVIVRSTICPSLFKIFLPLFFLVQERAFLAFRSAPIFLSAILMKLAQWLHHAALGTRFFDFLFHLSTRLLVALFFYWLRFRGIFKKILNRANNLISERSSVTLGDFLKSLVEIFFAIRKTQQIFIHYINVISHSYINVKPRFLSGGLYHAR
jgi:hypothetical protein